MSEQNETRSSPSRSPSRQSSHDDERKDEDQPQQQQQAQSGGEQQSGGLGGLGGAVGEVSGNVSKTVEGLGGIAGNGGAKRSRSDDDAAMKQVGRRKFGEARNDENALAPMPMSQSLNGTMIDTRTDAEKRIDDVGKDHKEMDESSLKIRIELDLDVEVHLTARVKGDITIGLM